MTVRNVEGGRHSSRATVVPQESPGRVLEPPRAGETESEIPVELLHFVDRDHGRTAPPFARKRCKGCGVTLVNKSRSWVCRACYPEYRKAAKRISRASRKDQLWLAGSGGSDAPS